MTRSAREDRRAGSGRDSSSGPSIAHDVRIEWGSATTVDRDDVGPLLWSAYQAKARALRAPRDATIRAFGDCVALDRCLVAWKGESLAGIIGVLEGDAHPLDARVSSIRRHFGPVRARLYALFLRIGTARRPSAGELFFTNLAVVPEHRRQGIATRLVERVEAHARERGLEQVGLEVTDTNHAALRLYDRMGYRIVSTRRYGPVAAAAGFAATHYLRKRLRDA
jgi:ribosomal protein S18 acetylase RimI-like enzyme